MFMADFGMSDPSGISWSDVAKTGAIAAISIGSQYAAKETNTIAPTAVTGVPTQQSYLPTTLKDVDKQMILFGVVAVLLLFFFRR